MIYLSLVWERTILICRVVKMGIHVHPFRWRLRMTFHPHAGADRVAVAEDVVHAGHGRPEFVVVQPPRHVPAVMLWNAQVEDAIVRDEAASDRNMCE